MFRFLVATALFAVVNASFKPNSLDDLQGAVHNCATVTPGEVQMVASQADLKKLQATGQLVVTDFYATWCGPCINFKPTFKQLAAEYTDVIFCQIDVDQCRELAQEYGISSMPTFKASRRISENIQVCILCSSSNALKILPL